MYMSCLLIIFTVFKVALITRTSTTTVRLINISSYTAQEAAWPGSGIVATIANFDPSMPSAVGNVFACLSSKLYRYSCKWTGRDVCE